MADVVSSWDEPAAAGKSKVVSSWDDKGGAAPAVVKDWSEPAKKMGAMDTVRNIAKVYPAAEAAMHAGTALVGGFPAYLGGGVGTLVARSLGMTDQLPSDVGGKFAEAVTYQPKSEGGKQLAAATMYPFRVLTDWSEKAGHAVADYGLKHDWPDWLTAALGAGTEATVQMAAPVAGAKAIGKVAEPRAAFRRPDDLTGQEAPFRPEGPGPTGTSSGVPVKLDRLIAEAQRGAEGPIEPPPVRQIIRAAAEQGRVAPQQGVTPLEGLTEQARVGAENLIPPPPRQIIAGEASQAQARRAQGQPELNLARLRPGDEALSRDLEPIPPGPARAIAPPAGQIPMGLQPLRPGEGAPERDVGRLVGEGEYIPPAPPRTQPRPATPAAEPDYFMDDTEHKIDVPRAEVRGTESGGANRKVYETVRFKGALEKVLANAGRDWKLPEKADAALRELKNLVDQLPDGDRFAALKRLPYPELRTAAQQYWREAREALLQARRENPTAGRVQVVAPDAERAVLLGRGEPPPEAPGGEIPPAPAPRAPAGKPAQSLLGAIKELGGLNMREIRDLSGEGRTGREGIPVGVFRKPGARVDIKDRGFGLDEMVVKLREKGFSIPDDPVDGGVGALRDLIRDELTGMKKTYAGEGAEREFERQHEARFAREDEIQPRPADEGEGPALTDEEALERWGPGTLGSNPMMDPRAIKDLVESIGKGVAKLTAPARRWVNAVQALPDSAAGALPITWRYAREIAYAKERAQRDANVADPDRAAVQREYEQAVNDARQQNPKFVVETPKTIREAIAATEKARRDAARMRMQRALYKEGYVVKGSEGADWKEFRRPVGAYRDLIGPDGQLLRIRSDAFDLVDQMVGAHDIAEQRHYARSLGGAFEAGAHGLVSWLMYNPMFHTLTTAGKGVTFTLPGRNRASILSYGKQAIESLQNRETFQDMMLHGFQPFALRAKLEPMGAEAGRLERGMREIGLDKPYDFYQWVHKNLTANAVNTIQASFYHMRLDQLRRVAEGRGEKVTPQKLDVMKATAARDSNLIGGNLPREELNKTIYRGLGMGLFSRGLTVSTVRMLTRAFENDRVIQSFAASKGYTTAEATKIMTANRNFLAAALVLDYAAMQITANALNWFTTSQNDEPGGKKGGHFVYENQGSDKSQAFLPTNIFAYPKESGEGVYMSTPIRTTRDIVEWAMAPFQVANGEPPKILHNKLGVPAETALETFEGKDWAGRPLGGPIDVASNIASKAAPAPMGDVPRAMGESMESGNWSFTTEAIKKAFDPETAIPTLLGAQVRVASKDPATSMLAVKQSNDEKKLWARVSRVKQMGKRMDPDVYETEIESVLDAARKLHMSPQKVREISRVMHSEGVSRSQTRAAGAYQSRQAEEGEIPPEPAEVD